MSQFDYWFWMAATIIDGLAFGLAIPGMDSGEIAYRAMWFSVCLVAFIRAYNKLHGV